jgi:hypothetical protein
MIRQSFSKPFGVLLSLVVLAGIQCLTACNEQNSGPTTVVATSATGPSQQGTQTASQQEILDAQSGRRRKVEITVGAYVKKVLPDDNRGLPHERFLIGLNNDSTVLVAHDTAMAPRIPLNAGDYVVIHGEYIWNEKGGVLHWTHHTDTARHEGGWIDFAGKRYQ